MQARNPLSQLMEYARLQPALLLMLRPHSVVMVPLVSLLLDIRVLHLSWAFTMFFANACSIKVDIYAPGTNITTRIHGDKLVTVSGSSYSASQVSGMAAFIIDMGMSSDKVCETIKKLALPSIQDPKPGTTKLLLYNGSGL